MGCNCGGSAWTPNLVVDTEAQQQAAANGKRTQPIGSGMFAHGDPQTGRVLTDAK